MSEVLAAVEAALVEHFAQPPQRASVSFVGVEAMEVLRFATAAEDRVYVTLGMSRHPMTSAADAVRAPQGPRAELLLRLRDPGDRHAEVWRSLAVLAAAPAVEGVVHRPGMSVDLGRPLAPATQCSGFVVTEPLLSPVETAAGPVDVLGVVPATATELAWSRARGVAELRAKWRDASTELLDLSRPPVALG